MFTTRQLERLWSQGDYSHISSACMERRPEFSPRLLPDLGTCLPAAALALIRLEEFGRFNHPMAARLLRQIIAAQQADGSFGAPLLTAVCLRALLGCGGDGRAIDSAIAHLAQLQRDDGLWPAAANRRLPGDGLVTAFILLELAGISRFAVAVRLADALEHFQPGGPLYKDPDVHHLARLIHLRHGSPGIVAN
jgi:hypothetical protein